MRCIFYNAMPFYIYFIHSHISSPCLESIKIISALAQGVKMCDCDCYCDCVYVCLSVRLFVLRGEFYVNCNKSKSRK